MPAEPEQPPPDPAPADAVGPVGPVGPVEEPPVVAPPKMRPTPEAPAANSTPLAPAMDPMSQPAASSSSSADEERQRRRLAAIECYNLGRRLDGLPPKRERMAENVRIEELPPVPDGDEDNLHAILNDDIDGASEYMYLANKEDIVERRLTPEQRPRTRPCNFGLTMQLGNQ